MNYKKAIIIGNGCGVLEKENGHLIDTFDYVVRMGASPKVYGFEKYVGSKTDMYRMKWFNMYNTTDVNYTGYKFGTRRTEFDFTFNDILCICQDPDEYSEVPQVTFRYYDVSLNRCFLLPIGNRYIHDFCKDDFNLNCNWFFFNACDITELMSEMNLLSYKADNKSISDKWIEPSGGLCTIWYFLKYKPEYKLFITGFDNWSTNQYWKPHIQETFSSHSSLHERIFINKLLKEGKINVL